MGDGARGGQTADRLLAKRGGTLITGGKMAPIGAGRDRRYNWPATENV